MMLTKPDCRLSLAFTTTLMLSALREGSQRLKACRHMQKLTVGQLFSGCSFIVPLDEVSAQGICQVQHNNPLTDSRMLLINIYVLLFLFL